jgi:hypothetical protein
MAAKMTGTYNINRKSSASTKYIDYLSTDPIGPSDDPLQGPEARQTFSAKSTLSEIICRFREVFVRFKMRISPWVAGGLLTGFQTEAATPPIGPFYLMPSTAYRRVQARKNHHDARPFRIR